MKFAGSENQISAQNCSFPQGDALQATILIISSQSDAVVRVVDCSALECIL